MKVMTFAPVAIPTLNRYEHLRDCIDSLARCEHSSETVLFVSVDYPPSEKYKEGYIKIKEFLEKGIDGFKDVVVIYQDHNLGAVKNCDFLKDLVFKSYDRLIFTEDDNVFSNNFLDFMNKALSVYQNNAKVTSVSGYSAPTVSESAIKDSLIFSYNNSAWGIGLWKDKEKEYESLPIDYYEGIVRDIKKTAKLIKCFPTALFSLIEMLRLGRQYGDTKRSCRNVIEDKYQVTPKLSMVRNCGHDGSGINGGSFSNDPFLNQRIDERSSFDIQDWSVHSTPFSDKCVRRLGMPKYRLIRLLRISFEVFRYRITH